MSIAKKLERLLQTKNEIKAAIESKGVIVAQNEPFKNYPAKIAAIQGGGAITLAEYDMSALQDNSVIGYLEAVPEGYVQVRIEGTGAMKNYSNSIRPGSIRSPLQGNTMLKKIIVKEGVTSIGDLAFEMCSGLTEIVIPDSVTSIGEWAFAGCTSLTEIVIPDSVTSIGDLAFAEGNPDLILKPEALEKPEGWSELWNAYDWMGTFLTVWWGGVPPQQ